MAHNDFSAFNPLVWGLFIGFVVLVLALERIFRARHPDYPVYSRKSSNSGPKPEDSRLEAE